MEERIINKLRMIKKITKKIYKTLIKDIDLNNKKIHMEHGDNYAFKNDPLSYIKRINSDIFLFGHTHIKYSEKIENTLVLNPGSLNRPRDSNKGSYIKLIIGKTGEIQYKFIDFLL